MKKYTPKLVSKVLIANRGEIALRIQRACDALGIDSVMIVSEADKEGFAARNAHQAVLIGPAAPAESYLAQEKILKVAKEHNCDAIHPGYGFLSENATFAQAVADAGLTFVGPSADSIARLGDKVQAREVAKAAGVPLVEGAPAGLSDDQLKEYAAKIGFPVMVKAVAGGGGRGMRIVHDEEQFVEQLPRVRAEALKFFSNGEVYLEKYVPNPRHVEVQILGDTHGKVLHFGTRDCSAQRRHQKLIEEAPAPFLSQKTRDGLHQAAIALAKETNYFNAGTVEFLVSGDDFYFLEMNTRIQVEHPVTEEVTGVDLVALQLRVANGEKLPLQQKDVSFSSHSIEFRVYAEDPMRNFAPSVGTISGMEGFKANWFREDASYEEGDTISLNYDAMVSKCIVTAPTRDEAIARSRELFESYVLEGVASSILFHQWLLSQELFVNGGLHTGYVDKVVSAELLQQFANATDQSLIDHPADGSVQVVRMLSGTRQLEVEVWHRQDGYCAARLRKPDGSFESWEKGLLGVSKSAVLGELKARVAD